MTHNRTSLHFAVMNDDIEVIKSIVCESNVNIKDDFGRTPLFEAQSNEARMILISHGADINTKDISKCSPLYYAIRDNHYDIAKLLLEHGADVNDIDNLGQNALHLAAMNMNTRIVKLLLDGHN